MRLSYIELRNYRRFASLKLQLPDGVIGILGLNGVGKSTIIEAVAWAMFGNVEEVVRVGKDSIRRTGASPSESCYVALEFELDGKQYRLEREMGGKNLSMRASLRTAGNVIAEDDKHVRKAMENLVGMDHKSFFTSIFARQKELNALQNVAPGERKKVVLRMLRIDSLDAIITDIRADKRDSSSRIEGAEKTLLLEDGREKEAVLKERIPSLEKILKEADEAAREAERAAKAALAECESVKGRRDSLKKDVDAFVSASGEMREKQSALEERRKREKGLLDRMAESDRRLEELPGLEADEREWESVNERKELMELEKSKSEKARILQEELTADEKEESRRIEELQKIRAEGGSMDQLLAKIEETESARAACQGERADLSGKIGGLRAKAEERRQAAAKDSTRLDEIKNAGKDGICPTCERRLEDSYELLVRKLEQSSAEAREAEKQALDSIVNLEGQVRSLSSKEEALKKRRAAIDKDVAALKHREASLESRETELARIRGRIVSRKKALEDVGEIRFSSQDYKLLVESFAKLKKSHDRFVELKALEKQREHYAKDLIDVRELIQRAKGNVDQLSEILSRLEPKKVEYESVLRDLDQKMEQLNSAREAHRDSRSAKERAQSDLEKAREDISQIAVVRARIAEDRKTVESLALLEEIVANFKDHLMSRIAPTLADIASRELEAMTGGRYSKVELTDDYEMRIDDQGTMYPIDRFSGGESDLANLSLRLAISRIIAERTGAVPINFLILDEIFGSQDPNRKRSVMTALSRLSGQFRQIILITHIEDVKDSMNYVVRVEELEDGTSKAELVG